MKTLLIHPYISSTNPHTTLTEPLGLMCLASYLEEYGYEVEILDLYALGYKNIVKKSRLYTKGIADEVSIIRLVKACKPEIIGIHCNFTAYAADAFEVAKIIKCNFKNTPILIGGAHVTMDAEDTLKNNGAIDIVVRGEGEITLKNLIKAIGDGDSFGDIDGITFRHNGKIVSTPRRPLIQKLDSLPIPDRRKIPMDIYLKTNNAALQFTKKEPAASLMTSRGCPFNCIFCSTKVVWERKWRPRSPEKVIEEIETLKRDFGVNEIAIYDDQFLIDKKRIKSICDLIIERKFNMSLSIPSGTSVWMADEELLTKMKSAGFYRLCFPIETGNENTIRFIKKPINLDKAKKTIALANRIGFWTQGNFIIGFPYETRKEIETTIKYAYASGLDYAFFYIAKPYAGSEMYELCKKEGLLSQIARGSDVECASYDTKTMSAQELQLLRDEASNGYLIRKLLFYMKPFNFYNYLLPKLSNTEDIAYALKILLKIIRKTFRDKALAQKH